MKKISVDLIFVIMEIIERENVNVANVVIVKGLTLTEADNELETYLQKYGSVKQNLMIDDPTYEFHCNAIVEYANSSVMLDLTPLLPLTLGSLLNPSVTFVTGRLVVRSLEGTLEC